MKQLNNSMENKTIKIAKEMARLLMLSGLDLEKKHEAALIFMGLMPAIFNIEKKDAPEFINLMANGAKKMIANSEKIGGLVN